MIDRASIIVIDLVEVIREVLAKVGVDAVAFVISVVVIIGVAVELIRQVIVIGREVAVVPTDVVIVDSGVIDRAVIVVVYLVKMIGGVLVIVGAYTLLFQYLWWLLLE